MNKGNQRLPRPLVWLVCVSAWLIISGYVVQYCYGAEPYQPGDIFATRNALEEDNGSPGYWNHLAVYVGQGLVVESQMGQGTIYSELPEFIARYPEIRVLRLRMGNGQLIADEACKHIGTPYKLLASLCPRMRPTERGNNCVTIVRRGMVPAIGRDPGWFKPDDAVSDPLIEILYAKQGATP